MRILFLIVFLMTACAPEGSETSKQEWTPSRVVTNQFERTSQFTNLVGRGVIEFKWTDDKGTHKEQGDLDFWKQGNSISLRISKLGELIAWFGGKGQDFWFFDFMGDEPTLTIGGEHGMFNDIDVALVLLGLSPLPAGEMNIVGSKVMLTDVENRQWIANYEPASNVPIIIEHIDGTHVAKALHRKSIRVEIENLHELHWPQTGGLIDITDNQGNAEIKISFSTLTTIVIDEPMNRVMNLEYLQGALKPVKILKGNEQ